MFGFPLRRTTIDQRGDGRHFRRGRNLETLRGPLEIHTLQLQYALVRSPGQLQVLVHHGHGGIRPKECQDPQDEGTPDGK